MVAQAIRQSDEGYKQELKPATTLREWVGLTAIACWSFGMAMNYYTPLWSDVTVIVAFCMILGISIAVFGFTMNKHVEMLVRITRLSAPLCLVVSATAHLLPSPLSIILYLLSAVLGAPIMVRRAYGLLMTCPEEMRFRVIASGLATASFLNMVFSLSISNLTIWFALSSLFLIPSWIGITRKVTPVAAPLPEARMGGAKDYLLLTVTILLFGIFSSLSAHLHTFLVNYSSVVEGLFLTVFAVVLPVCSFIVYAWLSDKKRERVAFYIAVAFFLIGILIMLVPDNPFFHLILAISDGIGGTYAEFFILLFPLTLLSRSRNPLFVCSFGIAVDAFFFWVGSIWSPAFLDQNTATAPDAYLEPVLLVFCAITVILIFLFVSWLMNRQSESSTAVEISALMFSRDRQNTSEQLSSSSSVVSASSAMGLLPEEQRVANLLIEGYTRGEIARKLKMPANDVKTMLAEIQRKLTTSSPTKVDDSVFFEALSEAARHYGLTTREKQVLHSFCEGKTNMEIAEELFVAESTVRTHIKSLMKKLPLTNRSEARAWLLAGADENWPDSP